MTDISKRSVKTLRGDVRALLESCPATALRRAARQASQLLNRELAPTGLGAAQLALLAEIAVVEDDRIGALAARLDLDQSTLSRNLRVLERAGLVEIASVERDLRRRAVWLTEKGARRLEEAIPLWRAAQQKLAVLGNALYAEGTKT